MTNFKISYVLRTVRMVITYPEQELLRRCSDMTEEYSTLLGILPDGFYISKELVRCDN